VLFYVIVKSSDLIIEASFFLGHLNLVSIRNNVYFIDRNGLNSKNWSTNFCKLLFISDGLNNLRSCSLSFQNFLPPFLYPDYFRYTVYVDCWFPLMSAEQDIRTPHKYCYHIIAAWYKAVILLTCTCQTTGSMEHG